MPKILLTSIIALFAIMPVFAETAKSEDGGLTCDASGVGATTANARMKASWTPTTYTLQWYDDDNSSTPLTVQSAAQTCDYGANLVLPSTNPAKLGYTFIGWELEEETDCGLSSLDPTISGRVVADEQTGNHFAHFSYGYIQFETICSTTSPDTAGTPDTTNSGENCWCRVSKYVNSDKETCTPTDSNWIFVSNSWEKGNCTSKCTISCYSAAVQNSSSFRVAMYGISQ